MKQIIFERLRRDLTSIVPHFREDLRVLCPVCGRPQSLDDLSLEHIVPQQALANDPPAIKSILTTNERSGLTLLCKSRLLIKGQSISENGCNGWKGKYYDARIKQVFRDGLVSRQFTQVHHLGLFSMAYLGLFERYGYAVALTSSGSIVRQQFFSPFRWLKQIPLMSQMVLGGEPLKSFDGGDTGYWAPPFKFALIGDDSRPFRKMSVVMRNASIILPVSRDPAIPLALALPYAPSRFKLRPQLGSMFD